MTEMTDTTATPRGERTREATDRKLMRATLQIAVDRGISGVTIEEVARRSGVAKTTIYRRYHNADEAAARGISAMYLAIPDPDPVPSPTREHFTQLLQRLVDWVRDNDIDVKRVGHCVVQRGRVLPAHRRPGGDPVAGACGGVPQAGSRAGRVSRGR